MELQNQNTTQKDFRNRSELRIFLSYFRPHRKLFYLDMVSALAIAVIDLAFPAGYAGDTDAAMAEMCRFVTEQDPKYSCIIKLEQSYSVAPQK